MSDGQIHPFNKSGVQPPGEAQPLQAGLESVLSAKRHHVRDPNQLAPPVAFLHLPVAQAWFHLPPTPVAPSTAQRAPLTNVGGERIKVEIEPLAGKEWEAAWGQALSQRVDELRGHGLGARAEHKHRQNLRAGIDGQPEHLLGVAEPGAQFVQLEVWEVEMEAEALMQDLRVLASASQKGW